MNRMLLALALAIFAANAFALPVVPERAIETRKNLDLNTDTALFEGIVKLSNCSGALITMPGRADTSKGLVLTNGHCLGGTFLKPGEVAINRSVSRTVGIYDMKMKLSRFQASRVVYATMTGTDITIYELNKTYAEINTATGIRPLELATTRPDDSIVINIPSGYWDRNWACQVEGFVYLMHEDAWTWSDSIRFDTACHPTHGTSGSPLVQDGTRTVIGINNTGNDDGESCTMNNPCEVDEAGRVLVQHKRSYGQQTYHIAGCFGPDAQLDLGLASCELTKP